MTTVDNSQPQSHTARNFAIAAGTGAAISVGTGYWGQSSLIKNKTTQDEFLKISKDFEELVAKKSKPNFLEKWTLDAHKQIKDIISKGKVDWTLLGKNAAIAAGVWGGVYLAFKGVASLFSKKDED